MRKFAAFILTHKRPQNVRTYQALRKQGYTGDVFLIVDDKDPSLSEYFALYASEVIVFSKDAIASSFDIADNFKPQNTVTYARNAVFGIANQLGLSHFVQLDDDYAYFATRFNSALNFVSDIRVKSLDAVFDLVCDLLDSTNAVSIAFAQNGDFIGGSGSGMATKLSLKRKVMNTWFCKTDRPFKVFGRMNDDVNTYSLLGHRGGLFFTVPNLTLLQSETQSSPGGLTEMYRQFGTYVKSFYTVMFCPSFVRVSVLMSEHPRIHHRIDWAHAVPVIMSEKHRKTETMER